MAFGWDPLAEIKLSVMTQRPALASVLSSRAARTHVGAERLNVAKMTEEVGV